MRTCVVGLTITVSGRLGVVRVHIYRSQFQMYIFQNGECWDERTVKLAYWIELIDIFRMCVSSVVSSN